MKKLSAISTVCIIAMMIAAFFYQDGLMAAMPKGVPKKEVKYPERAMPNNAKFVRVTKNENDRTRIRSHWELIPKLKIPSQKNEKGFFLGNFFIQIAVHQSDSNSTRAAQDSIRTRCRSRPIRRMPRGPISQSRSSRSVPTRSPQTRWPSREWCRSARP